LVHSPVDVIVVDSLCELSDADGYRHGLALFDPDELRARRWSTHYADASSG